MKSKYKNKKTMLDGITFDSQKEALHYSELKILERAGIIKDLELQPVFEITPKYKKNGRNVRCIKYKADFAYYDIEKAKNVVVDVKGMKTDVYKLKKKLVEYFHDIEITEV